MQTIKLESDPSAFTVEVLGKGFYCVDAFALQHAIAKQRPPSLTGKPIEELTIDEALLNFQAVVEAAKETVTKQVGEGQRAQVELGLTDGELFSLGSKVMTQLEKVGN